MQTSLNSQQNLLRGALLVAGSEFVFVSLGALVKGASAHLPSEEVVFFRNLFGLLAVLPFLARDGMAQLSSRALRFHLLRAVVGLSAMYCFFYALAHLPLANAMLLKQTAPLFIPLIAALWLGERLNRWAKLAIVLGFGGAALILRPDAGFNLAALAGLAGGFLAAGAMVSLRRLSFTEPALRVVFYFALIGTVLSALPLPWIWVTPRAEDWVLLLAMGPVASVAQVLLTRGYASAPAGLVGPFTYTAVIFAFGYGWAFWGEPVTGWAVLGAASIALAGIVVLRSGRAQATAEPRHPGPAPPTSPL